MHAYYLPTPQKINMVHLRMHPWKKGNHLNQTVNLWGVYLDLGLGTNSTKVRGVISMPKSTTVVSQPTVSCDPFVCKSQVRFLEFGMILL